VNFFDAGGDYRLSAGRRPAEMAAWLQVTYITRH